MPRGSKAKYSDKQKRQATHIEEGILRRGGSVARAKRIAWAMVNKESGGGKKSGYGTARATAKGGLSAAISEARPCILGTTSILEKHAPRDRPGRHRGPERLEDQVRARQEKRPDPRRPHPLQLGPLSGELRLHPADVLRRPRPARHPRPRARGGRAAGDHAGQADRRDEDDRPGEARRQDHRGSRGRPRVLAITTRSTSCRPTA